MMKILFHYHLKSVDFDKAQKTIADRKLKEIYAKISKNFNVDKYTYSYINRIFQRMDTEGLKVKID